MTEASIIKGKAESALKGRWRDPVIAGIIFAVVMGLGDRGKGRGIIQLILGGPITLGYIRYHLNFIRDEAPRIENLLDGFKRFKEAFILNFVRGLMIFLWALLLIVPGIIAAFRYSMSFYIMNDFPEMTAMEALNASKDLMENNKGRLFELIISFWGWFIIGICSFGIGFLWIGPYFRISLAFFYEKIREEAGHSLGV